MRLKRRFKRRYSLNLAMQRQPKSLKPSGDFPALFYVVASRKALGVFL